MTLVATGAKIKPETLMKRMTLWLGLALAATSSAQVGWERYRVWPTTASEVQKINDSSLGLFSDNVNFGETDVIVGPGQLMQLAALGVPYKFVSRLEDPTTRHYGEAPQADYRNHYYRYSDILAQYEAWRAQYPQIVTRETVGSSTNGRTIYAYKIAPKNREPIVRSVVVICGIHAREWISPACGMYVFDRLLGIYGGIARLTRLPKGTAYYMIPDINPDGYEYTWTNDRFWRKNRRNNGGGSYGVDLNRNFAKAWGGEGSSGNKDSEVYRGPSAFSEPETNAFQQWLGSIPPVSAYIDFHSYGQYILWPWAYTLDFAPGQVWLNATGQAMRTKILQQHGKAYTAGPTGTTLYLAAGSSPDYIYDRFNAAAYTIELRDTGQFGFDLPESQIHDTQDEAWAGFQELAMRQLNR